MEDPEEYSPDKQVGGIQTTPEGLKRRRMTYYEDRVDFKGKCCLRILYVWDILFFLEIFIQVMSIILCSLVTQNASLRQGDGMDASMLKGFIAGVGLFFILSIMRESTFRCSDEKTHQRGIRNESSPCTQMVYFVNLVIFGVIIGAWCALKAHCKEGTPCVLFDY
jgi:hypothetical protein